MSTDEIFADIYRCPFIHAGRRAGPQGDSMVIDIHRYIMGGGPSVQALPESFGNLSALQTQRISSTPAGYQDTFLGILYGSDFSTFVFFIDTLRHFIEKSRHL